MFGSDTLTSAMDTASQMLAGGSSNAGTPTTGKPHWVQGIHIDTLDPDVGGTSAATLLNELDLNHLLEFIHFGIVHTSYSNFFTHPSYKDSEKEDKILDKSRPRAIQFRSALLRETILLSLFMECTQTVLQARDDAKGALGTAMNVIGSLTGFGGGGSGQTTPADLNSPIQEVVAAAKPLLAENITYPITHKAGMDLNQARADYRAILKKISGEKPTSDGPSSLLGKLPGLSGAAGPMGDIISLAQGIAFKSEDVKVKFFVNIAIQQEPQIETACNAMTLKAISDLINPVLPVWFGDPNAKPTDSTWTDAPASPLSPSSDPLLGKIINPVANTVTQGRDTAVGAANKVKSFFENPTPPTPPPGTDFLSQAFEVPKTAPGKQDPVPMDMAALSVQAFIDALDLKPPKINSFCASLISTIFGVALDFIHGTYEALLVRDPQAVITDADLYAAAIQELKIVDRLKALALDKVSFIQKAKDFTLNAPMGYSVRPGDLLDKGATKLDDLIDQKIAPVMDDALKHAMKDLAKQLDLGRQDGNTTSCLTMEFYLGRLPWTQASLFCNLFFPFWDALLQCLMGVVDPATASILKTLTGLASKAKGIVDTARDDVAKAQALKTAADNTISKLGSGVSLLDPSQVGSLGDGYGAATKAKAAQTTGPTIDRGNFTLPVTGRTKTGTGAEVPQSPDYDQVLPTHQWGNADPPPTPKDPNADPNAAPAAADGSK